MSQWILCLKVDNSLFSKKYHSYIVYGLLSKLKTKVLCGNFFIVKSEKYYNYCIDYYIFPYHKFLRIRFSRYNYVRKLFQKVYQNTILENLFSEMQVVHIICNIQKREHSLILTLNTRSKVSESHQHILIASLTTRFPIIHPMVFPQPYHLFMRQLYLIPTSIHQEKHTI